MKTFYYTLYILIALTSCSTKVTPQSVSKIQIKKDSPFNWNKKEPCEITYINNKDTFHLKGKIKLRGGESRKFYKRSYALELDQKIKLGNLPKEDDWIINATYIDKTFMRHKISFDLYRQMNPNNKSAQCSYAQVEVNGKYTGFYVIMQELNAKVLEVNKKDTNSFVFKDPPVFFKKFAPYIKDSSNFYQQKYPKQKVSDKSYIMNSLYSFIHSSNEETFEKGIKKWFDYENLIDWHLILLFSNNGDGLVKNYYLYKKDSITPIKVAIWDYDHSFGRDGDNELNMLKKQTHFEHSLLIYRLNRTKGLNHERQLKARYHQLRKNNIFSEANFSQLILENDNLIKNEVGQNFNKWPLKSKWYYDENSYQQELETMKKYVKIRIQQLDERFDYKP